MKRLFKNILFFLVIGLVLAEIIARVFSLTSDIPQRVIDENQIQKYYPYQQGYWVGGEHGWSINKLGWPGELPASFENIVTIIGDSYIENFMNPKNCRQAVYLKDLVPKYNYFEASRSGISFIETLEIAKQLDTLQPIHQLIYVHDSDFMESVLQVGKIPGVTQLDIDNEQIVYGTLKSPRLKKILYTWKFIYYLYNNSFFIKRNSEKITQVSQKSNQLSKHQIDSIKKLMEYSAANYNIRDLTLVFRPNPNKHIIEIVENSGFKLLVLEDNKEKEWTFEFDKHWTCIGHEEASKQVARLLKQ